jgi:hypothetical protein
MVITEVSWPGEWCIPVVPALGRLRQEDQLNPGIGDHLGQHSKTTFQKKKKKLVALWFLNLIELVDCVTLKSIGLA